MTKLVFALMAGLLLTSCGQDGGDLSLTDHQGAAEYETTDVNMEISIVKDNDTDAGGADMDSSQFYITANGITLAADFEANSSADALRELLGDGDLTIEMSDYGDFEKVGSIGVSLPQNNEQITTEPGDVILYQGNSITIYYDVNTWNFTRLGKIADVTREELLDALGDGDVTVTISLTAPEE